MKSVIFTVPGLPLILEMYQRPEKISVDNLPAIVLPIEIAGSGVNPDVKDLFIRFTKQEGFDNIKSEEFAKLSDHVVNAIDAELRRPAAMEMFGCRMVLHDRTSNGVKFDATMPTGETMAIPPKQNKGMVAVKILQHIFRPGPKTMVVLDNDLFGADEVKLTMVVVGSNGLTLTTVDPVKFKAVLEKATQPHGTFTMGGVTYTFFMAHPFINLSMAFDPTTLHGILDAMLLKLTMAIEHVNFAAAGATTFDPVQIPAATEA